MSFKLSSVFSIKWKFSFCKVSDIMEFTAISIVNILNVKSVPKANHYVFLYWTKANQSLSKLIKPNQTQSITTHVYFNLKITLLYPVLYTYLTNLHPIYLYQTQSYPIKPNHTWSLFFAGCSGPKLINPTIPITFLCRL